MRESLPLELHELIQSYFDKIYKPFQNEIQQSLFSKSNEIYGELYYYSVVKLLEVLEIQEHDHFLDIGSGLGKLVFQLYLTTPAATVTGIEINSQRHHIAYQVSNILKHQLPGLFTKNRALNLIQDDFLTHALNKISIAYVCATVFSFKLICDISQKLNNTHSLQKIVSLRKLPYLNNFTLTKRIFIQGTWDNTACYIYTRKNYG
jgi:hypothetical protein